MTVKRGGSATIVCSVDASSAATLEIEWQTRNGVLISEGITRLNNTALQLIVQEITEAVDYQCIARNSISTNAGLVRVTVVDVPSPPRDPSVTLVNRELYITWVAPVTDNGRPLTGYYVQIRDNAGSVTERVSQDLTGLGNRRCRNVTVMVTAENDCGNSSAVTVTSAPVCPCKHTVIFPVVLLCHNTHIASDDGGSTSTLPVVIAGVVVVVVFILLTILVILLFLCWWKKQRTQLETKSSVYGIEAPVSTYNNTKCMKLRLWIACR